MSAHPARSLSDDDRRLVDLVAAELVDPNLHTDTRMHLHHEITEILRTAHLEQPPASAATEHPLASRLAAVLVEPTLHTDTRLSLHRQIQELLQAARRNAPADGRAG